ncbi:MAG: hypothetical protein P1U44_01490 [Vicingaceae bacterium]|nr:hypothetical protein [Vicingaceae bacterium]
MKKNKMITIILIIISIGFIAYYYFTKSEPVRKNRIMIDVVNYDVSFYFIGNISKSSVDLLVQEYAPLFEIDTNNYEYTLQTTLNGYTKINVKGCCLYFTLNLFSFICGEYRLEGEQYCIILFESKDEVKYDSFYLTLNREGVINDMFYGMSKKGVYLNYYLPSLSDATSTSLYFGVDQEAHTDLSYNQVYTSIVRSSVSKKLIDEK